MTKFERNGAGGGMMSKKKYELTPEEEAELEREIERTRLYLETVRMFSPGGEEYELHMKLARTAARSRIIARRKRREAKAARIKSERYAKRHASIANLISQTHDILFPPEDDPVVTPEEQLLQAIFGRENNVPMAEEMAFVDTVTNMAETLVRKYHASTSQQEV